MEKGRVAFKIGILGITALACPPPPEKKPIEMQPIGTVSNAPRVPEEPGDGGPMSPNSGTPLAGGQPCTGADVEALDRSLDGCDVPMPKPSELPSNMKEKLDVRLSAGTSSIAPGGRVDVTVILRNKSNEPLALWFSGDPTPRFEVEALDSKGKRVDIPTGKQPAWPKGTAPPTREVKASRYTLEKGGSARIKLAWDATKWKWAPEKAKTWEGRGFPREKSGSLAAGKYTLRVVLPLIGVYEKNELEIPKVPIDVVGF